MDRRLKAIVSACRGNVVRARLWKRFRRSAAGLVLLSLVPTIFFLLFFKGMAFRVVAIFSSFFQLVEFLIWVTLPLIYAKWAYRISFQSDPSLQMVPLKPIERLAAILVPLVGTVALCYAPKLVFFAVNRITSIQNFDTWHAVVSTSQYAFSLIFSFWVRAVMIAALTIRFMLLEAICGRATGRKWPSVALLYGLWIGYYLVDILTSYLMIRLFEFFGVMGGGDVMFLFVCGVTRSLLLVVGMLVALYVLAWRRDWVLVRDVLFGPEN